jgi:carbamate kinase
MRTVNHMRRTALVAIGGNALAPAGEPATVAAQRAHVVEVCGVLAQLVAAGWRLVVTHGNGPQVGAALRRSELGAADAYPLPLDMCVASTQGEIGVLLQQGLREALHRRALEYPVATILTQVIVSADDPAFARPTKPVGAFYSAADAETRRRAGWMLIEEPPHGYRRVVPSPEPLAIVEERAIRALLDGGVLVIALGGGGIPVVQRATRLEGIEAVIDKDLASAMLAIHLRVNVLAMVTDVDRIYVNFARPDASGLGTVTAEELRRLSSAGHFPPGTMGPKAEAALRFIAGGGSEVIVTSPDRLVAAMQGHDEGTRVMGAARAARRHRGRALASTVVG